MLSLYTSTYIHKKRASSPTCCSTNWIIINAWSGFTNKIIDHLIFLENNPSAYFSFCHSSRKEISKKKNQQTNENKKILENMAMENSSSNPKMFSTFLLLCECVCRVVKFYATCVYQFLYVVVDFSMVFPSKKLWVCFSFYIDINSAMCGKMYHQWQNNNVCCILQGWTTFLYVFFLSRYCALWSIDNTVSSSIYLLKLNHNAIKLI